MFLAFRSGEKSLSSKRKQSLRLIWLEAFVYAVEMKSFKKAGEKLDVDATVIGRYVKSLEEWLSRVLIRFYEGNMIIYEDAEDFLPKAKTIIDMLETSRDFVFNESNYEERTEEFVNLFTSQLMRNDKNAQITGNLIRAISKVKL